MDLYVNAYGVDLEVENGLFYLETEEDKKSISPELLETIYITTSCTISTNAIALAVENNIDLILISKKGRVLGRFWHGNFQTTSVIRKNQAILTGMPDRFHWVSLWVWSRFDRQLTLLRSFEAENDTRQRKLKSILNWLTENETEGSRVEALKNTSPEKAIRTHEAHVAKKYFDALALLLPDEFVFHKRTRQPAKDAFNAMLNYCYAILYNQVESVLQKTGLDPYLGFMHENDYQTKSFVFDFIEPYRPWADYVCVQLCRSGEIKKSMFDIQDDAGCYINDAGKKILIPAYNDFMHSEVKVNKKNISRLSVMKADAHKFTRWLLQMK